jgi:hypothetical protein
LACVVPSVFVNYFKNTTIKEQNFQKIKKIKMSDQEMSKKRKIYCTDDGNSNENTRLAPHKIAEYEQAEMSDLLKYQLLLACFGEAIEKNRNVFRRQENIEYLRKRHSGMEFDYRTYQSGIFILHRDEKITHKTALILSIKIQQKTNDFGTL